MKSHRDIRVKQLVNRGRLLAPATAVVICVLETSSAGAQSLPYYGPHPWWGSEGMFFGPGICVVAAAVCAVLLVRWLAGPGQRIDRQSPLDILRERFADGEIEKEEFDERRRILGA
jgi:putative membrane protein